VINSIHPIRTYIKTSIILLPTILFSLHFSLSYTLFSTFQSLCIMISSCAHVALTWLAGITIAGLITCSTIFFPVTLYISIKNIITLCPSFNLKASERQQLYEIWLYMGLLILYLCLYNPINFSANLSSFKVHLYINVRMYFSFGPPFLLMKSTNSSQCPTSVYKARSCFGARTKSLPLNAQCLITVNIVFGNSGMIYFISSYSSVFLLWNAATFILPFCARALPNPSRVAGCLAYPFSSPLESHVHSSSKTSQPTATKSIQHNQN